MVVRGTTLGTSTGIDGAFSLQIPAPAETDELLVNFIGYEPASVKIGSRTTFDITLRESAEQIDEVVVTALGLTRKEKSLGYAVTKLGSDALNNTVSSNWLNGMAGKVAGLNFDQAGQGPGGSIRVTLRGESSLTHDNNTALFVIDGVPISSDMESSNSGSQAFNTTAPIDYGNGASDLNPEDIESVSVLKGPAATALYGSRAANGAIVITTKSGRQTPGLGISFNSSVTFEKAGFWPDFQSEYGAGNGNSSNLDQQRNYNYWSVPAANAEDGIASTGRIYSRVAFGAKFDGQQFYQYESRNWDTDMYRRLPWEYRDWYKGFFDTGVTWNNSIAFSYNNGKGTSARFSVKDSRNDWIVPNTGYDSQNLNMSITSQLNKWLRMTGKVTYYRKNSDNMPMSGYSAASPLYTLIWNPNVVDVSSYYREYAYGRIDRMYEEGTPQLLINSTYADNVYMQVYEQLNTLDRDRVFGNMALNINLAKGLTLDLRTGMDFNNEFRTQRKPWYSNGYPYGYYKEQTVTSLEVNSDFLLSYTRKMGDFDMRASFGGNNMLWKRRNIYSQTADGLLEKNVYKMANSISSPVYRSYRYTKSINSFYGFLSLGWRDMVYLDITGRNDWSSTLAPGNNSYFYPSVSASVLLDQVFNFKEHAPWVDLLKVRGSWANVGNDTSPNKLVSVYSNGGFPSSYYLSSEIQNYYLKPENVESWEVGLEGKLFKSRLNFDVAYYHSETTDQIITVPIDQAVGATSVVVNAGCVRNRGVEISARFQPVKTKDFEWTISANWSKNWNKLVELADGVAMWNLNPNITVGGNIYIRAYPGTELGRLYGRGYERAPEGAFYVDADGLLRRLLEPDRRGRRDRQRPAHLDRRRTARPGKHLPRLDGRHEPLAVVQGFPAGAVVQRPVGRQDLFDDPLRAGLSGQAEELAQRALRRHDRPGREPQRERHLLEEHHHHDRHRRSLHQLRLRPRERRGERLRHLVPQAQGAASGIFAAAAPLLQNAGFPGHHRRRLRHQPLLLDELPALRPRGGLRRGIVHFARYRSRCLPDDPDLRHKPETGLLKTDSAL